MSATHPLIEHAVTAALPAQRLAESHERPSSLDLVLGILRRRGALIAGFALFGTVLGLGIGTLSTPRYTAKALLVIAPQATDTVGLEGLPQTLSSDAQGVETQLRILTSREHLLGVVDRLGLDRREGFAPPPAAGPSQTAVIGESLQDAQRRRAAEALAKRLTVVQEGRSLVIGVAFTATDPVLAAEVANAVVAEQIDRQLDEKRTITAAAERFLVERVEGLRAQVETAERAVEAWRVEHGLADDGKLDLADTRLGDLAREVTAARADLAAREARLERVRELRRTGRLGDGLAEVAGSPVIVDLRRQDAELSRRSAELGEQLGPRHPQSVLLRAERRRLAGAIAAETGRIVAGLEDEVAIARSRLAAVEGDLAVARGAADAGSGASIRLRELQREATAQRDLYQTLLGRLRETQAQAGLAQPDLRLVSAALPPETPSSPGRGVLGAGGLVAFMLVGIVVAAVVEHLQRGLRSPVELRGRLGLRTLAMVPKLGWTQRRRGLSAYLRQQPMSAYGESIRRVLASLTRIDGRNCRTVLVTSALPGEGKTTLAISLALLSARSGSRTLLVDLDMRRPSVAARLGLATGPGLVAGFERTVETDPRQAFSHHVESGLTVLTVGPHGWDPLAVMRDPRLAKLLQLAAADFDQVIIDSPPLLAVPDAQFIATMSDTVVLALRWNATEAADAAAALELLGDVGAKVGGAVLTCVEPRRQATYGYADRLGRLAGPLGWSAA